MIADVRCLARDARRSARRNRQTSGRGRRPLDVESCVPGPAEVDAIEHAGDAEPYECRAPHLADELQLGSIHDRHDETLTR